MKVPLIKLLYNILLGRGVAPRNVKIGVCKMLCVRGNFHAVNGADRPDKDGTCYCALNRGLQELPEAS